MSPAPPVAGNGLLELLPEAHPRVWGGSSLGAGCGVGEVWLAHPGSRLSGDETATLAERLKTDPSLLGGAAELDDRQFPWIIKWLDTSDWMSVQVHPDDAAAVRLAPGSGWRGKTEAWIVVAAAEGASLRLGLKPGVSLPRIAEATGSADVFELLAEFPVRPGDAFVVPPGVPHALGPGLTLLEVQTRSDLTFRLWDHGRDRPLQLAQARASLRPDSALHLPGWADAPDPRLQTAGFSITRVDAGRGSCRLPPAAAMSVLVGPGDQPAGARALLLPAGASATLSDGVWWHIQVPSEPESAG